MYENNENYENNDNKNDDPGNEYQPDLDPVVIDPPGYQYDYQPQPVQAAPQYTSPPYQTPPYAAPPPPPQTPPPQDTWSMYSPGLFANQPYPRNNSYNEYSNSKPPRKKKSGIGGFVRAVCLVLVCTLLSASAAYFAVDYRIRKEDFTSPPVIYADRPAQPSQQPEDSITNITPSQTLPSDTMSAEDIYDLALTQVVGVNTEVPGINTGFGESESTTAGSGTGFIISNDGYILTNYHVIELAHAHEFKISVVLSDNSSHIAEVIGFDQNRDVALIKIEATGLNPALIGNSSAIRVGQQVYAVGNPFGDYLYTMTDGIISALDRIVAIDNKEINTFQFSAAVNSGNSGGPIYNEYGEVIGIVTAKVIRSNVEGIGFAIPIDDAMQIAVDLIDQGYISGRPLLGVSVQTVSSAHADYFEWVIGVYVSAVNPGSAAEAAGMQVGDIITGLGDAEINSLYDLQFALLNHNAGDTVTIKVWRKGITHELTITFDEDLYAGRPDRPSPVVPDDDPFKNLP